MPPPRRPRDENTNLNLVAPKSITKASAAAAVKEARDKYSRLAREQARAMAPPRPSLAYAPSSFATRPSLAPRPSLARPPPVVQLPRPAPARAPAPLPQPPQRRPPAAPRPIEEDFVAMPSSLAAIRAHQPVAAAPGARQSTYARRAIPRPSLLPGGVNPFESAAAMERFEARFAPPRTPRRLPNLLNSSATESSRPLRSVRFAEAIEEQRESLEEQEVVSAASSSVVVRTTVHSTTVTHTLSRPSHATTTVDEDEESEGGLESGDAPLSAPLTAAAWIAMFDKMSNNEKMKLSVDVVVEKLTKLKLEQEKERNKIRNSSRGGNSAQKRHEEVEEAEEEDEGSIHPQDPESIDLPEEEEEAEMSTIDPLEVTVDPPRRRSTRIDRGVRRGLFQ